MEANTGASLLIQGGPNTGMTIPLTGRPITLGRRQDNDVVVDVGAVSRRHALIIHTGSDYVIRDLNSTNGTYVNKERISVADHVLSDGDQIRLAVSEVVVVFRNEGAPTARVNIPSPQPPARKGLVIDARSRQVYADGRRLDPSLDDRAFELLRLLESRRDTPVATEEIARTVWPEAPAEPATAADIALCADRLRERLERDMPGCGRLVAIGEFGYRLE